MFIFFLLSLLTIVFALLVVFTRQVMYSVFYMILTMFSIAAHFLFLGAKFLGLAQIIIYSGAIMILFIFVVMLLDLRKQESKQRFLCFDSKEKSHRIMITVISCITLTTAIFLLLIWKPATSLHYGFSLSNQTNQSFYPTTQLADLSTQELGKALFGSAILPFELISILFLSAIIGVLILVKE